MKILILGANGLIGSAFVHHLLNFSEHEILGTVRNSYLVESSSQTQARFLKDGVNALKLDTVIDTFKHFKPNLTINCIGVTKHRQHEVTRHDFIKLNSVLPHFLSQLCLSSGSRLIQISTDCVFSGSKGMYRETDLTDSKDLYGKSKAIGEMLNTNDTIIRTSTIGHETRTSFGLLEWFLSQQKSCKGFTKSIFSGLTSNYLASVVTELVIEN